MVTKKPSNRGSVPETRLCRTETKSREGCQEFRERLGCVESLSTMNGQFECQQDCSRVSLSLKEVFLSRIVVPWWSEPQIFATKCLRTALSCATVVPHFIWCHILHSNKRYITIFAIAGNEMEWAVHQTNSSHVAKNGLGTRLPLRL